MKYFGLAILLIIIKPSFSNNTLDLLDVAETVFNSEPDSSFQLCLAAEKNAIADHNEVQIGLSKLCKVRYYLLRNKLEDASEDLSEAIKLFQKNNYKSGLASAYISMANIDGRIKKKKDELEYLEKANSLYIEMNDTLGALKTLTNLALNYVHSGQLERGKEKLELLDDWSEGMPEKELYYVNQNWGIYYDHLGDLDMALQRFQRAKSIAFEHKMIDSQATIYLLISNLYLKMNDVKNALSNIEKSYQIAVENNLIVEQLEALETMNKIYEIKGEIAQAYKTYKQIIAIRDTIYNVDKINKLNDYEKKIELAEKEKVITSKNLELERHKNQLLKDKYGIYALVGIVIIISVSVIFLLINLHNRKKAHHIITEQKNEVESQKKMVENKNREITSSITYAKRIQEAILPGLGKIQKYFSDSFVFYKAKDIVSGDFYWVDEIDGKILFATVDCTGHGVPGAFMSIVGNNGLNKAVREDRITQPARILDALNTQVFNALNQKENVAMRDGMDIALCSLDLKSLQLEYSGAFNPLYILRKDAQEIDIIKADKQAIGQSNEPFTNHTLQLNKDDILYIFTDGFPDQFGGEKSKKYTYSRFRKLLLQNRDLPMNKQGQQLESSFVEWKGNEEQVDDICVLGIKM